MTPGLASDLALFLLAGAAIAIFGIRMTTLARDLAQATGLGEAFMGAVFIGATTSLSGIIASATAASHGAASLAVSNSLGGIAAQTVFLVIGDLIYRKANLEFAAASVENLMMCVQLMLLLCILLVAFTFPEPAFAGVHPASIVLIAAYLFTLKLLVDVHEKPMWLPRMARGTVSEGEQANRRASGRELVPLLVRFLLCAVVVGSAGWLIARAGMGIVDETGLSTGIMGGIFIAVSTSLPELVVAVTAIRLGSLTLAVGDIVGGNAFDTLFIAISDFFYAGGSIYTAVSAPEKTWLAGAMLMTVVLLMGLIYRERKGIANVGLESVAMLLIYAGTVGLLVR